MFTMPASRNTLYNSSAALVLGILQFLVGLACILVQVPMYIEKLYVIDLISVGIWTGVFDLISAIMATLSWKQPTNQLIRAVLVMSVIACVVSALGALAAYFFWFIGGIPTGNQYEGDQQYKAKLSLDLTYSHVALCCTEFVLAMVMGVVCCRAVCCVSEEEELQMTYIAMPRDPR